MKSIWEANMPKTQKIPAGTTLVMPYVWSHTDDGHTPSKDISLTTENEMSIGKAVTLLEKLARDFVITNGAKDIRQYFVEDVEIVESRIMLVLAT